MIVKCRARLKIPIDSLFFLYVVVNSLNCINVFVDESEGMLMVLFYTFLNVSFYLVLYNMYCYYRKITTVKNSLWFIIRGYIWLCTISILGATILFLMIKGGFNPYSTPIANDYYDLFKSNVEVSGATYYFPYHISVLATSDHAQLRIPFFTDYGVICGLFHEPHVITFITFPALFLLLYYIRKKYFKVVCFGIWLFIMLLAASTTNILAFFTSLFVLMFFERKVRLPLFLFFIIVFYMILSIGMESEEFLFLAEKLNGDNTVSSDYSKNTLIFAFSPKTLMGSNFINNNYLNTISTTGRDVGYLPFLFNILFLIVYVIRMIKIIIFSNEFRYVGIATLYFFIHSMKTAMVTYTSPLLLLMMFMLFIVSQSEKRTSHEKKYCITAG